MALLERLKRDRSSTDEPKAETPATTQTPAPAPKATPRAEPRSADRELIRFLQQLKFRVHSELFEVLDLGKLSAVSEERAREDVAVATRQILDKEKILLTVDDRERLVEEIKDEVFGLGPLEPLLQDPKVTDILVNGPDNVYVERFGKLEKTDARFNNNAHLMRVIERIVSAVGRRVDETSPMVDARLADGSRVNAIVAPLALDGPSLSIRRFGADPLKVEDLIATGAVTPEIVEVLDGIVKARLNVLVSGGTGAGKTTLLNALSSFIPGDERIVTIEDSAELQLKQEHVVRLETRPANLEGKGAVTQRELVINSLRMRPDRIVMGEVRGSEALDMLQAMNTGHDGSLTTIHANTPRDALTRVETMVAMSGLEIPARAVRSQIGSALNVVIQLARLSDGTRKLVSLQEITGMEGDVVTMQEIFRLEREGVNEDGTVQAEIRPTGIPPRFADKLAQCGIKLSASLFELDR